MVPNVLDLQIYFILGLVASAISFILGCCFLFITIPQDKELHNYKLSRRMLAFAYFVLASGNVLSLNMQFNESDINLYESFLIALIIASFQAFLFTITLITLLNPVFLTKRKIFIQLIPICAFSGITLISLLRDNLLIQKIIFAVFLCFYFYQLIFYTIVFLGEEKKYKVQLYNYFSGDEADKLAWVRKAFFFALGIGIMAALCMLYINIWTMIIFIFIYSVFYVYFGIRYLSYPSIFYIVKTIQERAGKQKTEIAYPVSINDLSERLELWVQDKGYLHSGITINDLSNYLGTNRTYLSNYINKNKEVNFNTWINMLRIEEAKLLMEKYPEWPISKISEETGFSDPSCFGKQFKKQTGHSPKNARNILSRK